MAAKIGVAVLLAGAVLAWFALGQPPLFTPTDRGAAESLHAILSAANRIHFRDDSGGYGPPGPFPVVDYALQRVGDRWTGTVNVAVGTRRNSMAWNPSARTMSTFFNALRRSPLTTTEYVPYIEHTDDYPRLGLEIEVGARRAVIHSESQGSDHVPWAVDVDGRRYTVPSAAPSRALKVLLDSVDANDEKRLIDELKR